MVHAASSEMTSDPQVPGKVRYTGVVGTMHP